MRRITRTAALFGLCGWMACGSIPVAKSDGKTVPLPADPAILTPLYIIDSNVGANVPYGAIGITTDGTTWALSWRNDDGPHTVAGDIYGSAECILYGLAGAAGGSRLDTAHIQFSTPTASGIQRDLLFSANCHQVSFVLSIDGVPVGRDQVVFPSGKQLSTIETSPFSLVQSVAGKTY